MINKEDLKDDGIKQIAREGLRNSIFRALQLAAGTDVQDEFYEAASDYILAMLNLSHDKEFDPFTETSISKKIDMWANDESRDDIEERKKYAEVIKQSLLAASYIMTGNHNLIHKNLVKLNSLINYTR